MGHGRLSPSPASPLLPLPPPPLSPQVFLVRKVTRPDSGHLYAMKVLKKATLKGEWRAPPHAEPRPDTGLRETAQPPRGLGLMEGIALSSGMPGLQVEKQACSQPPHYHPLPPPPDGKIESILKTRIPGINSITPLSPPSQVPMTAAEGKCLGGSG